LPLPLSTCSTFLKGRGGGGGEGSGGGRGILDGGGFLQCQLEDRILVVDEDVA